MKKILLLAVFITSSLVAQETTTNVSPATTSDTSSTFSFAGLLDNLKKSPLSLSFFNEVGSTRSKDKDVNGFYNDFNTYLGYKLTDADKAVNRAIQRLGPSASVEDIIKTALNP